MRFVVQEHRHHPTKDPNPDLHWDLMLAEGDHLATWRVPAAPARWTPEPLACRRIADHRRKYLSYEGPLSDDRGAVQIVAAGNYRPIRITADQWHIRLESDRISGTLNLQKIQDDQWQLSFQGDIA
ncbi:MAG: hypothetical protein JW810_13685 [Sedimentisphaerales bacterium]|nr:hypothetical protein [Sedimentisphaerales bacterium]